MAYGSRPTNNQFTMGSGANPWGATVQRHNIPMSGGGGGGQSVAERLIASQKQAYDDAKQANLDRYSEIKTGYQSRHARAMGYDIDPNTGKAVDGMTLGAEWIDGKWRVPGMLDKAAIQERKDLNTMHDGNISKTNQNLAARGLSGTTIGATLRRGVDRSRAADMGRLNDRLTMMRANMDADLSGDSLSFMERRTDEYPDSREFTGLLDAYGESGGGGGGGGIAGLGGGMGGSMYGGMGSMGYMSPGQMMGMMGMPMGSGMPYGAASKASSRATMASGAEAARRGALAGSFGAEVGQANRVAGHRAMAARNQNRPHYPYSDHIAFFNQGGRP